jgi:hypothetical protein
MNLFCGTCARRLSGTGIITGTRSLARTTRSRNELNHSGWESASKPDRSRSQVHSRPPPSSLYCDARDSWATPLGSHDALRNWRLPGVGRINLRHNLEPPQPRPHVGRRSFHRRSLLFGHPRAVPCSVTQRQPPSDPARRESRRRAWLRKPFARDGPSLPPSAKVKRPFVHS